MGVTESLAPRDIACSAPAQILASCKSGSLRRSISVAEETAAFGRETENMKRSLSTPLAADFWENNRELYGLRFAKFVERELLSTPTTG
jgi:hypothetical protein